MIKRFLSLILIVAFSSTIAQQKSVKAVTLSIQKIEADSILGEDSLGNLYYLKNNVLCKKNKVESWQYENISLGKINRVAIQNPLKTILVYENFNTIILLDNQLNETQKINFSENSIPINVSAAGIASQNRLWIYDTLKQQIILFDYLKNTFNPITPSFQGNFKYYDSDFNTFQWIDDKLDWYSCSIFGKIIKHGKVSAFDQIKPINNHVIVFSKDEKMYLQDLNKNSIYLIENIKKSFKNFYYKDQILSIFTNQEITNYKIIIP
jgi:hypothetical protein